MTNPAFVFCQNCGAYCPDNLHEVHLTTSNEIEHYCTECYNEWFGIKPSKEPKERVVFT